MELIIDAQALGADLDALAAFSDDEPPGVTRLVYGPADLRARAYLRQQCDEAGLVVREDGLGNLFARWPGSEPDLPAVASGSHIDALPHAGRFDGTVGVVGALEALRALRRAGFQPRRSLEMILFTSEEPTRFGLGCLGSRAMIGALTPDQLRQLRDGQGRSLDEWRTSAGFTAPLEAVALVPGAYGAFVELHIEQGPLLEVEGLPIGVVRAIAAPAALRVVIRGQSGHAGSVLMLERRDALLAGAELALAVEAAALGTGSRDTVATTGIFTIGPGAVNAIPNVATLEIDVRDIDLERRDQVLHAIKASTEAICARRHVTYDLIELNADPPATSDPAVVETIIKVCDSIGLPRLIMISRAYHDSLFMARICPTAMIFIPSRGGISHRSDEDSDLDQIGQGVAVLAHSLAALSHA